MLDLIFLLPRQLAFDFLLRILKGPDHRRIMLFPQ